MNALVKKEIRLLLPAWVVAVLLAMVQGITRPYDFYVASLLFFGLTIMALSSIGRETSLNTFSSLLSQPAERIRIWQVKLTVLAVAFLVVFVVWLAAFGIAFHDSEVDDTAREESYNLFITICLIATATFTGGLWTTLLLRQVAGAFWLTLVVPATLSGFSAVFFANSDSDSLVIAILSVVIGIYSIAGFFFARQLYFRAQDVGWSGGVIAMPEWKFLAHGKTGIGSRARRPIFALLKKEILLQQGVLTGAAGLLVLHAGIVLLRTFHHFGRNSPGEALTAIFWMLWLVLPVIVGCIAVAEERKAGVMESQLCLPASRRIQFIIKAFVTLLLGVFLGGVMPVLVEVAGAGPGGQRSFFTQPGNDFPNLAAGVVGFAAWLVLVSFFASSLAKSFLQAVGYGVATFFGCMLAIPLFTCGVLGVNRIPSSVVLSSLVAVPTLVVTLLWLAYLNFKDFREGWLVWRRILTGIIIAGLFVFVSSNAVYHRAWEILERAEPAHGPAKLVLANPPLIQSEDLGNSLTVQLPDGRVWFDRIGGNIFGQPLLGPIRYAINPFPASIGPQQCVSGSNWVSAAVRYYIYGLQNEQTNHFVYLDTVGIKSDGTLWVSAKSSSSLWVGDQMTQFGNENDWKALSWSRDRPYVLLLKKDGTLWCWGASQWDASETSDHETSLRELNPYRMGTNSDWQKISQDGNHLQKTDGSLWWTTANAKTGKVGTFRDTDWDNVDLDKIPPVGNPFRPFVRKNGTLWISYQWGNKKSKANSGIFQIGDETNWVSVAGVWMGALVALKSDGTLWQRDMDHMRVPDDKHDLPTRLGIHDDWVALTGTRDGAVALAADGSLWLWPCRGVYDRRQLLMELPKQPKFLGNVFESRD